MLVDTHAHIYTADFSDDRDQVIANAVNNGISKIMMPNIDTASIPALLETADRYRDICYPMMGLHPTSVRPDYHNVLDLMGRFLTEHRFYGIGETGIDLYWDKSNQGGQEDAFRIQLQMARSFKLPVIIHVRNSFNEVYDILEKEQDGSLTGIFHCFSGTKSEAEKVTGIGFFLGIGGVVTYKNSHLPEIIKETGIDHLVIETDAPWLAPIPYRGKRNEPGYLLHTAGTIAGISGLPADEVAAVTTGNALRLFNLNI